MLNIEFWADAFAFAAPASDHLALLLVATLLLLHHLAMFSVVVLLCSGLIGILAFLPCPEDNEVSPIEAVRVVALRRIAISLSRIWPMEMTSTWKFLKKCGRFSTTGRTNYLGLSVRPKET